MSSKPFLLCFEAHRPDGLVWSVKVGRQWQLAASVIVKVPIQTVYLGAKHRQPKAYLTGTGVVRASDDGQRLTVSQR